MSTARVSPDPQDRTLLEAELRGFLDLLFADGGMHEVRALDVVRTAYPHKVEHVEAGYFRPEDLDQLLWVAGHYRQDEGYHSLPYGRLSLLREPPKGVYISLNPIKSAAYAKAPARMVVARKGETSADSDVDRRTVLLIDVDAPREVSNVSAAAAEKAQAAAHTAEIIQYLTTQRWPRPIEVDSGNGCQLLYRIDLPVEDDGLVERVLKGLATTFPRGDGGIDLSVHNPARIARLPSTWNRKAHSTQDRPHRLARVLDLPTTFEVVPQKSLMAIAALAPEPERKAHRNGHAPRSRGDDFDEAVRRWNADHPRDWPSHSSECLICGSPDGMKASSSDPSRWCCFSSRHSDLASRSEPAQGLGVPGSGCFTGDALDVEAWTTKRTRAQVLRNDGYLLGQPPKRTVAQPKGTQRGAAIGPSTSGEFEREEIIFVEADSGHVPLHKLVPGALALLAKHAGDWVFVHADALSHIAVAFEGKRTGGLCRSAAPRILRIPAAVLRERLDAVAKWIHQHCDRQGTIRERERWCPREVVDALSQRGEWRGIRNLIGVTSAPVLRADGTILNAPGYDTSTQVFYAPTREYPPVPSEPSDAELNAAIETLYAPFEDFPTEGPADRAATLAFMLSIAARTATDGPVPLTVVMSPTPGTGKTLIIDAATTAMTGYAPDKVMVPGGRASDADAEWRKRIATVAMEASRVVLIDNLPDGGTLQVPALAAALTADELTERLLGQNRSVRVPHRIIWAVTGNNVAVAADLARRSLSVLIDAQVEDPHLRGGFRIPALIEHVRKEHPSLLVAALTVLRAFVVAGRPQHGGALLGMFEAWDRLVRSSVVWATGHDPLATQERLRGHSPENAALGALFQAWNADLGDAKVHAADLLQRQALAGVLAEACPTKGCDTPTAIALGRFLARFSGRVVRGLRLVRVGAPNGKVLWVVRATGGGT